ncbi:MAG: NADH-ubiquinone oxidoreductase-F iron-sulfur binding region domain-containing protein [Planctomycetia bacterium]|nr:NADH-ubiquinone oxidoreductase-F iron-sulfur binding region domain-containing protein [Planctomycetia bacterium]
MAHETKNYTLEQIAANFEKSISQLKRRIIICGGTGCIANGSLEVRDALAKELEKVGEKVEIELHGELEHAPFDGTYLSKSGCQGFCQMGPLMRIEPEGIFYTRVKVEDVPEIVNLTLLHGEIVDRLVYVDPVTSEKCRMEEEIQFYTKQNRVVLKNCTIEAESVGEYVYNKGYFGARKAVTEMTPEEVCQTVLDAGLRGRGGGGFPTGLKWKFTLASPGDKKYVICNGDEGDPGAFMDRSVMEGNPHAVLEGMIIAGKAIGADEGVVYVRAEYPLAVKRMKQACADAEAFGLLGNNLFGTDFNFHIRIMEGAGAFVCGEETALIASVEGKRGMPMPKPPFPAQSGLYGKPTVINNVETLASVPYILREGAEVYRSVGTEKSPGTKTFALTGHVANTGLIEVPFGTTLRKIVYEIGGGVTNNAGKVTGEDFKSVQIGGPSGGCLTPEMLDMPLDFDSLKSAGAMVGSGGLVVMNNQTCMVGVARFFMQFTQNESCGKCVPCREGTKQMLALLDDIMEGRATAETLEHLEQIARAVQLGSLCGLGKTAPNPVLSTLRYFREEYEAHVFKKICPTGECKALALPEINPEKCKGCTVCAKKCPVGAIQGELKKPHVINVDKCIRCGACKAACKFHAISGV